MVTAVAFSILNFSCGCCSKLVHAICNLRDNLDSMKNASDDLNNWYLDVKVKVEMAESNPDPELKVLNVVRGWMGRVEVLQNKVNSILQQGDQEIQARCFGGRCPKNCLTSYKLSKKVTKKLSDVNDLRSEGHFDVVAVKCARDLFEELCSCFQNDEVGISGLYGMGGVGKTTLLKKFNNDFLSKLKYTCLLKDGEKENTVKMHDVIRRMALWVASRKWQDFW
ncbi:hypothetical protein K1719_032512 [Acacia pycnantha]|nr:hypothetical protein K1719_032512 [Acacia pycnantha]